MSMNLRKVFGRSQLNTMVQGASRGTARNELTSKWLNRLQVTANTADSREVHTQLSSILDWYNRPSDGLTKTSAIDWETFKKNIHTPRVVDAIKTKYDEFLEAEFLVDGAVAKCGVRSETMKQLDVAMNYNYQLWLTHYLLHLNQIETMHNIGDVT